METLVANLAGQTRRETRDGREFIVAPVSMIVPGVLNGSSGALFYPADEIRKSVDAWNGMPLTLGHPLARDGKFPSARSPEVMDKQGLGTLYNTRFVNGKLAADAWFDLNRLATVDNRVLISLQSGTPIELSTGLSVDNEDASEGSHHEGTPYEKIARNYRPDHLAILVDQKGACSINDGCGVLINANTIKSGMTSVNDGHQHSVAIRDGSSRGFSVTGHANGHTHFVNVFTVQPEEGHTHTIDESKLIDTGIQNEKESGTMDLTKEQRKEIVTSLVENSCCHDAESRDMLTAIDDRHLVKLKEHADLSATREMAFNAATAMYTDEAKSEHTWNTKAKAWETKLAEKKEETVVNENPKPQTDAEWMAAAPAAVKEAIVNAQAIQQREKDALVAKLVSSVADGDKAGQMERLQNRSLEDLRADLALRPAEKEEPGRAPDYSGAAAGDIPTFNTEKFAPFGLPDEYISADATA